MGRTTSTVVFKEGVSERTTQLLWPTTIVDMCSVLILLNALTLALGGTFRHRSREKRHEFADRTLLIERERGKIGGVAENNARTRRRCKYY